MSRFPEEPPPLPPRGRRPASDPTTGPKASKPDRSGLEGSTFRPNPAGSGGGGKTRSSRASRTRGGGELGTEVPAPGPKWWERILFGRISSGQLAQFCRQFGSYLHAGVDFTRALSSLGRQFAGTALGPVIGRLEVAIRRGSTLEDAMACEPQAFGPMFLSMIRVAEASGRMPEILKKLSHQYEFQQRMIRQARSAMIYPIIVLVVAGGVIALITIVLLPMFVSLLQDISRGSQLPWASRALMAFSSFVRTTGWWLIPAILIGTPFLLIRLYKTPKGKDLMDRLVLMTPVFGLLCRKIDTTRFARILSSLLDAGLDYPSSIDLTADALMMSPIRRAVRSSREKIMAGQELGATLAATHQFSTDVISVISSGEETGKLPESLDHLADDYEEQVDTMLKNLGQLVQPLLILILGGIVLFIILAVLLPYIQVLTSLAGGAR
ncbi:MAG TPA: type II secretion system F family protein [Isosphaeraceae bacterium]|nr:type II secretion system F family protein [Isosphaeraceae bacterium]